MNIPQILYGLIHKFLIVFINRQGKSKNITNKKEQLNFREEN